MFKYQTKSQKYWKNVFENIFTSMDLFGQPPTLRVMKKQRFASMIGVFFTISIVTLSIIYFSYQMIELFQQSSPFVITSDSQIIDSTSFPMTIANFTLGISVTDMNYNPLKTLDKYFTITVQNCARARKLNETTNKIDVTLSCTDYPTEACSDKHFFTDIQKQYFSQIRLGQVQCMNKDMWEQKPPRLSGTAQGSLYEFILIKFGECKNTTQKQDCAPKELIDEELRTGYYITHLMDNVVKMDRPGFPFEEIITLQYTSFSISSSKTIFQSYQIKEANTDAGLITTSTVKNTGLVQFYNREVQELYNDEFIVLHYLNIDSRSTTYTRSYIKIQGIFSTVGGFQQILFLIVQILLGPLIRTFMQLQMANKLFKIEQLNDFQVSSNKNIGITKQMNVKEYIKKRRDELNIDFFQSFLILIGCKGKLEQQLQYARDKLVDQLDIVKILSKLQEIDKLKQVLLTPYQMELFNYLPKPTIPLQIFEKQQSSQQIDILSSNRSYNIILQYEQTGQAKFQSAYYSYQHIKQNDLTMVDQQLIELMDDELIQIFESMLEIKKFQCLSEQRQSEIISPEDLNKIDEVLQ